MVDIKTFTIESKTREDDGLGGFNEAWSEYKRVKGYIDMLGGSDMNSLNNAISEESTHILIIPNYEKGINDTMRVRDINNRYYSITYSDNPLELDHHNEIYLKYGGVIDGA